MQTLDMYKAEYRARDLPMPSAFNADDPVAMQIAKLDNNLRKLGLM